MEKFGEYVKRSVLNFKLEQCCFVASVRTGALTLACVNLILGLVILVGISKGENGFDPLFLQALKKTTDMEEEGPDFIPWCVVAYAAEIASNALNDIVLLRAYLYYALGVLTAAVMVYSVVFMTLDVVPELLIVASVVTQLYQIMLVRSAMVEIKHALVKNGYTVNLKHNPESSDKYTVAIEPELKPTKTVTKQDISKPVLKGSTKEVNAKEVSVKEGTITVHSPAKEAFLREETEVVTKPTRFGKEKVKMGEAKVEKIGVAKKI